ncbi:MAG TPA: DUF992 domain-containing protein [Stellaceae bacterium]|nr:DUF992 domain-containing protein [Stellaceae bacterium]
MMKKLGAAIVGIGVLLALPATAPPARAQGGVQVGVLTCNVSAGWGFVFGSTRRLRCTFAPRPGYAEHYIGTISKFGVDIGYLQGAVMVWGVVAPTTRLAPGSLAGNYVGVSGGASVGVGATANVLVGGSRRSITLQPVSIQGNSGLNVAAGVAAMTLRYVP